MPIPVGRLAPGNQWDQNILDRLFANDLYPTGLEFKRVEGFPPKSGGILLIPGRYWVEHMPRIEDAVASHRWLLVFRVGDEESLFDPSRFAGPPNIKWWIQTPRAGRDYGDARLFGVGFPPHFNRISAKPPPKTSDVFLSAQKTHARRLEAFEVLRPYRGEDNPIWPTGGFTEGIPHSEYALIMANAKIAPAPSGAYSPDSFRLYEALESHTIPAADDVSPIYGWATGYWRMLFPEAPFPIFTDYAELPSIIDDLLGKWPANANRIAAWWMRQKRQLARWLVEDLQELGAV